MSSIVSDQLLQPFLAKDFDPVQYLNNTLPTLSVHSSSATPQLSKNSNAPPKSASLADLSAQTQTLLSQLNAQITRLSNTLTQLTDDILRTGSRLAYEVEVLRGETVGLAEVLTEGLQEDVNRFVGKPLKIGYEEPGLQADSARRRSLATTPGADENFVDDAGDNESSEGKPVPEFVTQLRTLSQVRARLDSVVQVFGEAMQWTIPPSEVSLGSSLISVSAPEPGTENHSREEKGREFAERLRNEIADTITGPVGGTSHEAALERIQALRQLSMVWRGTAEEKARVKFVDGLVKLAEDRARAFSKGSAGSSNLNPKSGTTATRAKESETGGGFLENLQRIRSNIYLD